MLTSLQAQGSNMNSSDARADLVFYADHPAALAAFRKHGYTEGGYIVESKEYVFYHSLEKSHKNETKKREQQLAAKTV